MQSPVRSASGDSDVRTRSDALCGPRKLWEVADAATLNVAVIPVKCA